jgi:hypothetical protein
LSASRTESGARRARCASTYFTIGRASVHAYDRSAQPIALLRKNSFDPSDGSMQAKRKPRSVSALKVFWQRIAERRFQRSPERLHARIARRIGAGSWRKISPSLFVASASTRSHHAPVTIVSSYSGRDAIVWKSRARRSPASSIAA